MKKILILLIVPILLSGCYDYNELGDLAIVAGVGIDYEDEEFVVTFEILSTKKEGDNSSSASAYTVSAHGKTITEAFANNGNNLDKVPYYDHIEVVVISDNVAKGHLKEISEYLIRSSKMRNEFYMVIANDAKASEIISTTSKEKPIASTFIVSLLENSNDTDSAGFYAPFTKTFRNILTDGEDAIMSSFTLEDENIVLNGMGLFRDFQLVEILKPEEASIVNLLNNFKTKTVFFKDKCDNDKETVISIYASDIKLEPGDAKVVVKGKLNARLHEDACNLDLKKEDTYQKLEKDFTKVITKEMKQVLNKMQALEVNTLYIGKNYYNKTRKKDYYLWTKQDFEFDFDLKINKKGLIFEVKQ